MNETRRIDGRIFTGKNYSTQQQKGLPVPLCQQYMLGELAKG
jgi:hypothetical protein